MALLQSTRSVYCIFLLVCARAVLQHLDLLQALWVPFHLQDLKPHGAAGWSSCRVILDLGPASMWHHTGCSVLSGTYTCCVCYLKTEKNSAKCLHFGSARWSSVFFLWRGPLDPQKLHWGSRSLGFHRLSPSLWPACDLLRHLPYVKFLPTSYSQPDIIK